KSDVEFYTYSGGKFSAVSRVKKLQLSLNFNGQKIPVIISYIQHGGKTLGFGTYVTDRTSKIYKYAFFKLCDMPKNYKSKSDLLLLVDFDAKDIFKSNKSYSEVFELNSKTLTATRAISIKGQNISVATGAMRDDFTIIDDCLLNSLNDTLVFLSSRNYKQSNGIYGTDIYSQKEFTGSPQLVAANVLDSFVLQTDKGILYLKDTSKDENKSFSLVLNNGKEKIISTFQGQIDDEYLRCGKYLFCKGTMTLYNLEDNSESVLLNISMNNIYTFAVSPDQTKVALGGSFENGMQKLVFYDLSIKRFKAVEQREIIFEDYPNLCFEDNNTISYIKHANSVDMIVGNFVINWDKIFSILP
ncbi:MAG: hypothetical protein RSD17_01170, partial [Oscillospiraceae bacterium]